MNKMIRIASSGAAALALAACGNGHDGVYIGYVEADYVYAAAQESGWVITADVAEGDVVAPGDILFELDKDR